MMTCPHCGKSDGPVVIQQSLWFYCQQHKVKWLAGWVSLPDEVDEAEQHRCYDEIGLGEFKYLGPDAEGYEQFVADKKNKK